MAAEIATEHVFNIMLKASWRSAYPSECLPFNKRWKIKGWDALEQTKKWKWKKMKVFHASVLLFTVSKDTISFYATNHSIDVFITLEHENVMNRYMKNVITCGHHLARKMCKLRNLTFDVSLRINWALGRTRELCGWFVSVGRENELEPYDYCT